MSAGLTVGVSALRYAGLVRLRTSTLDRFSDARRAGTGGRVTRPPPRRASRYSPVVWLSLVCLDAPIVAVAWQWLFARIFGAHLTLSLRFLLFLTAWLIYLADRFADTIKLPPGSPISLRHQFCREHMMGWWIAIVVIFLVDASFALRTLDLQMLLLGGTLAAICGLYLLRQSVVRRKVAAASGERESDRHSLRRRHDARSDRSVAGSDGFVWSRRDAFRDSLHFQLSPDRRLGTRARRRPGQGLVSNQLADCRPVSSSQSATDWLSSPPSWRSSGGSPCRFGSASGSARSCSLG